MGGMAPRYVGIGSGLSLGGRINYKSKKGVSQTLIAKDNKRRISRRGVGQG